ncbi:MAG: m23 peptidase protein [uncultured bacterium (gcode 4)]|uniref:M23 peptidase protein n=1 Tax=uncultured bacterium (gcode 4) TaxID=1234023 RepID=K1XJE6_9BACT|nr:MAG: m23 peptidase protein [uncultured bacterium (gcode 4)]
MSVEQPKTTPETWPDSKSKESWEATIEATKEQLAEAYLNFLDQQKWGLLATGAGMGVNLNPLQKDAMEYLTTEKSVSDKKDIFSNIGKKIKEKFMEKITWWTMLAYDKKSLNKMKALIIENKDNQKNLQDLILAIKDGIDPITVKQVSTQAVEKQPSNAAPWDVAVATWALVTWAVAADATVERHKKIEYKEPIEGSDIKITSEFGERTDPITWEKKKQHNGIDIAIPEKTPVHSIVSGKVIKSERDVKGWWNYIAIQWDDGKTYSYLHLYKPSDLEVGESVNAGDIIWKVGSTGHSTWPHLHLTIKENDKPVDPLVVLPDVFDRYTTIA